jgi:hypothetical protein
VTVLAEDWWCFCPLRYLAAGQPNVEVIFARDASADAAALARPERRFLVGFVDGPCDRWLSANAPTLQRVACLDYAGGTVLYVWDLGDRTDLLPAVATAAANAPAD